MNSPKNLEEAVKEIEELKAQNECLRRRCATLGKGITCIFCNYECEYRITKDAELDIAKQFADGINEDSDIEEKVENPEDLITHDKDKFNYNEN